MGIFTKLLRNTVIDISYKFGMMVPICFTYVVGMELSEIISKKYNINKLYFQGLWNAIHYFWVFFYIGLFINTTERISRKYHMIQSRKC